MFNSQKDTVYCLLKLGYSLRQTDINKSRLSESQMVYFQLPTIIRKKYITFEIEKLKSKYFFHMYTEKRI